MIMEQADEPGLPAVIRVPCDAVAAVPRQVARYAGGGDYRAGSRVEKAIVDAIGRARTLAVPAVALALHGVSGLLDDGRLLLENGWPIEIPPMEREPTARCLAAAVCTVGPALEDACRELAGSGDVLASALLDAAGVAIMENLSDLACDEVSKYAGRRGLRAGCRLAPGCGEMPVSSQELLFRLVDAGSIGVRLNPSLVMHPGKSLSFFVVLSSGGRPGHSAHKCRVCSLKDCRFRTIG